MRSRCLRSPAIGAGIVVLALGAGLAGCGDGAEYESSQLPWTLVDVGRDGRSPRVQDRGSTGGCDQGPFAKAISTSATEIRVEVTKRVPTGDDVACPAIAYGPATVTVRLDRRVSGQRITGPRYEPAAAAHTYVFKDMSTSTGAAHPPRMRNVVGLQLADARRVLRPVSVTAPTISGPSTDRAVVQSQQPAVGTRLAHRVTRRQNDSHIRPEPHRNTALLQTRP